MKTEAPEQKPLSEILDGIEKRANFNGTNTECAEILEQVFRDHRALVKALRRAVLELHPVIHRKAEHDITAILNQK